MFKYSSVRNRLLTTNVFFIFLVWYMLGGRLNISFLATFWVIFHGATEISVEWTPTLRNNRLWLWIYGKETSRIPPPSKSATLFYGVLMIPLSNPIDAITISYFFVKLVKAFSIMNFFVWCFNSVLNSLNTDMSKGWMRWVEFDGRRTKIFLNLIVVVKNRCWLMNLLNHPLFRYPDDQVVP